MAFVELDQCSLEIPINGSPSDSLRATVIGSIVGGRILTRGKRSSVGVLEDISLSLRPGTRLGIVGPNGSGKSSLLRLMAGIYEPSSGAIQRSGTIATLFDLSLGLDPDSTGRSNIRLMAIYRKIPLQLVDKFEDEIIDFSELGGFIDLPVRTYSSGMMLRLAFSVSVILKGDIILMDEWLAVGDSAFALKAEEKLMSMVNEASIFAIATHNPDLVHKVCTSAITLREGRILYHERELTRNVATPAAKEGPPSSSDMPAYLSMMPEGH